LPQPWVGGLMLRRGGGRTPRFFAKREPQISGVVFREGASRKRRAKQSACGSPRVLTGRSRLMPEWMASGTLAFLLALAGGFAAHYTLLTLGVMH